MMVEVFKKGLMTGIDMMLGAVGSCICLGCLSLSGWLMFQSIKQRQDEVSAIYFLASIPSALAYLPIAWWVPAEAWVCTVTVYIVSGILYITRRLLEQTSY